MLSKVDRSVLEALPAELREQVERSWTSRDRRPSKHQSSAPPPAPQSHPSSPPRLPTSVPAPYTPPAGTLVLQIPNSPGIVLELPKFSQVNIQLFKIVCIAFISPSPCLFRCLTLQNLLRLVFNRRLYSAYFVICDYIFSFS